MRWCWLALLSMSGVADAAPTTACTMETRQTDGGPVLYATDFLVDAEGALTEEQTRSGTKITQRTRYQRDADRRVIEKCMFTVEGTTETPDGCAKLRYKGKTRRLLSDELVGADGDVVATTQFKFDARGREVERKVKLASGKSVLHKRSYDAGGRLVTITIAESFGSHVIRHQYSKSGELERQTVEVPDADGKPQVNVIRTFVTPCTPAILRDAS
jgi:hypothetical protein